MFFQDSFFKLKLYSLITLEKHLKKQFDINVVKTQSLTILWTFFAVHCRFRRFLLRFLNLPLNKNLFLRFRIFFLNKDNMTNFFYGHKQEKLN